MQHIKAHQQASNISTYVTYTKKETHYRREGEFRRDRKQKWEHTDVATASAKSFLFLVVGPGTHSTEEPASYNYTGYLGL